MRKISLRPRNIPVRALVVIAALAAPAADAQTLTLDEAIAAALRANPALAAADADAAAAREAMTTARAPRFPALTMEESWQRGNNPVFVFSSLLARRQFSESSLALGALNHPAAIDHHRLGLTVRQPLFDGGATGAAMTSATAATSIAVETARDRAASIATAVTQAFAAVLTADTRARAAAAALESAREDLARSAARYDEGQVTEADTLAIEVHVATVRSAQIQADADARIARTSLNTLMSADPERAWQLVAPPVPLPTTIDMAAAETEALSARADVRIARLRTDAAGATAAAVTATRLPRVTAEGGLEWNGGAWADRRSSWIAGLRAEWSFPFGGSDAASARAAAHAATGAASARAAAEAEARLDVRSALVRLDAAHARIAVGGAAVRQAREAARIVRNRYDVGLAGVADLLRTASAVLDAEALEADAVGSGLVAGAQLDRALGRVPPHGGETRSP